MYAIHPACAQWPRPSDAEFAALVTDIRINGLLNPIYLTGDNEILEGKIRHEACLQAGVEPRFETYTGDDPIGFTISQNKLRRHMSPAQLALIGVELAKLRRGSNQYRNKVHGLASPSTSKIAQQLGITRELIKDANALKKYAEPNVIELVKTDQVGLKNAACYARHTPREEQRTADRKTVKKQGNRLRSPIKHGLVTSKRKPKKISGIEFSPEQCQELFEQLRPLIKRLRFQSKQHIASFAPYELERIAAEMEQLLTRWANAEDAARQAPPSVKEVSG